MLEMGIAWRPAQFISVDVVIVVLLLLDCGAESGVKEVGDVVVSSYSPFGRWEIADTEVWKAVSPPRDWNDPSR